MNTLLITCTIISVVCALGAMVASFSSFIPMIVDRKSWKVWKQCYNDDNFVKTVENEYGTRYDWVDNDHYAIVFKEDDAYDAAIFKKNDSKYDSPLFCTYYAYHSKKLAKKLMASNR